MWSLYIVTFGEDEKVFEVWAEAPRDAALLGIGGKHPGVWVELGEGRYRAALRVWEFELTLNGELHSQTVTVRPVTGGRDGQGEAESGAVDEVGGREPGKP